MSHLKSCHCCGLIQRAPDGVAAVCARCETALESWMGRLSGNRLSAAFAIAALILYIPAVTMPFLRIEQLGRVRVSSLLVGMRTLFAEGHTFVGLIVLVFSIITPLVKLSALLVLSQERWQLPHRHRARTYRMVEQLGRWGMLDVLLVAVMVAFIKLGGVVEFGAGPGLATFALFVIVSLIASVTFDPYCLWDDGLSLATEAGQTNVSEGPRSTAEGQPQSISGGEEIPDAKLSEKRTNRTARWFWLIPLVAVGIVGWIGWSTYAERGRLITVSFSDGHGIQQGDELRYHGILAGNVENVRLTDDLSGIVLDVRLTPESDGLGRKGARFRIVRPQADLTGIAGLETVVGSKYLTVLPTSPDGPLADEFVGLDDPPLPDLEQTGGVEIVLQSAQGNGLRPGLGVFYRNIRIGGVIETGLADDGTAVETRVYIQPQYRHLICERTEFWNAGGVHVVGGLTSLSVHIGTLESLIRGGIGVSVPPNAGDEVPPGHEFRLHDRPEKEWLEWQPTVSAK
ncbi:MAG: paraquat-inducible protein A [Planctomycetaceae bacterium]